MDGTAVTAGADLVQVTGTLALGVGGRLLGAANGATLDVAGHAVSVTGTLAQTGGTAPLLALDGAGTTLTTTGRVLDVAAGTVTLTGAVLETTNGASVTADGGLLRLAGDLTGATTGALFSLTGGTHDLAGAGGAVVEVAAGSTLTTGGGLLATDGTTVTAGGTLLLVAPTATLTVGGPLLDMAGGSLTGSGTGAALDLNAGGVATLTLAVPSDVVRLTGGAALDLGGGTLVDATGTDLDATSGSIVALADAATLVSTATGALLATAGGSLTASGSLLALDGSLSAPSATLAGGLLDATGTTVTTTGAALSVRDGSILTGTSTGALVALDASPLGAARLLSLGGGTASVSLAGTLLTAVNASNLTLADGLLLVDDGGALTTAGPDALVQLSGLTLTQSGTGATFALGGGVAASTVDMVGALLTLAGGTTLTTAGGLVAILDAAVSTGSATAPWLDVDASTLTTGAGATAAGTLVRVGGTLATSLDLGGSLLRARNGASVTASGAALEVSGGTLTSTGTAALVQLDAATLTVTAFAGAPAGDLVSLNTSIGPAATVTLAGALLAAANGATLALDGHVVDTATGTLALTSATPLVTLDGATLTSAAGGLVKLTGATTTLTLDFAALATAANGGALTLPQGLVNAAGGAQLITLNTTALVGLDGGTHALATATDAAMFRIAGVATDLVADPDTGENLGTDRPIQHAGAYLGTTGATVTGKKAVQVDTALVEAFAPLLLLASGASAGSVSLDAHAIDLVQKARLSGTGAELVRIDATTLSIANGALVNLAGGSKLTLTGDLVHLLNGATLNVSGATTGVLLNATGNSFASIGGVLVRFTGTGNTINVTNSLAPTGYIAGIPVFSSLGGTTGFSVTNANAFANFAGGTININGSPLPAGATSGMTGSLLAIQGGTTTQVRITGLP
jgi:hypothetical protein